MTDDFFIWSPMHVENSTRLESPEGVKRMWSLYQGSALSQNWGEVTCDMDANHPSDIALLDVVDNGDRLAIVSPELRDFLKGIPCSGVEYLPITIRNHKGKVASREYSIVNPYPLHDAIDAVASGATFSEIKEGIINEVEKLVLVNDRIPDDVSIFRPSGFIKIVVVRRCLAELISAAGFLGIHWIPASAYPAEE